MSTNEEKHDAMIHAMRQANATNQKLLEQFHRAVLLLAEVLHYEIGGKREQSFQNRVRRFLEANTTGYMDSTPESKE